MMTHIKRYTAFLLALALFAGLIYVVPREGKESYADTNMVATPSTQAIGVYTLDSTGSSKYTYMADIPVYAITQANGFKSNYVRLRDFAYYADIDVVWNAENPNAMYIYTNRHYLDSWEAEGAATATQMAAASAMEIYVNDVKVDADVQPVLINNNNFFKIRDLCKVIDYGCAFHKTQLTGVIGYNDNGTPKYGYAYNGAAKKISEAGYTYEIGSNQILWSNGGVYCYAYYPYKDDVNLFVRGASLNQIELKEFAVELNDISDFYTETEKRPTTKYESSVWYGGDSGTLSDTPVIYSARDAWAKEDYWNSELNKEYREYLESVKWENNPINPSEFNALVQLLLDANETATDSSGQQKENVYYQYPMTEHFLYPSLYSNGLWGFSNLPDLEIIEDLSPSMVQDCYVVQIAEKGSIWDSHTEQGELGPVSTAPFVVRATQIYAADVINKSKTFTTNREQVTYLAQQLCERMTYIGSLEWKQLQEQGKLGDGTGDDVYNYSVWKNRDVIYGGVCMGYTSHFSALAAAAGFYVITYGVAENGDVDHSRNAVWLEDEGCWVAVDCTWADAYQNYLMGTGDRDDYICYDDEVPHWRMGSGSAKIYTAALQLSGDIRRANGEIKVTYTPTKDTTSIKTDSNVNDNNSLTNADASDDYGDIGIATPVENETAPERATITFDANGGAWKDGSTTMNVAYEAGYCNALPPEPKRDGYTFWSWSYDCVWGESKDFPETCMSLSAGTNLEGKDGLVVQAIWKKK